MKSRESRARLRGESCELQRVRRGRSSGASPSFSTAAGCGKGIRSLTPNDGRLDDVLL